MNWRWILWLVFVGLVARWALLARNTEYWFGHQRDERTGEVEPVPSREAAVPVSPAKPVARLRTPTSDVYIDLNARVLGEHESVEEIPAIEGYDAGALAPGEKVADGGVLQALEVLALCEAPRLSSIRITRLSVAAPDHLVLGLHNGCRVLFHASNRKQRRRKLEDLVLVLATPLHAGRELTSVDMRVDQNYPFTYERDEGE